MIDKALVWYRRDLRDYDHAALALALDAAEVVYCAFIFDREILDALPDRRDRRVHFIRDSLVELDNALRARGGGLIVRQGLPLDEIPALANDLGVRIVFANRDYEPAAKNRDRAVRESLAAHGIHFECPCDQAIFDGDEVLTHAKGPFTIFTPYKNCWLKRWELGPKESFASSGRVAAPEGLPAVPSLESLGFAPTNLPDLGIRPGMSGAARAWDDFRQRISGYHEGRDFPAVKAVSYLSIHLRFGTLSIRELARAAWHIGGGGGTAWLNELIWRDFYFMILDRFPHVVTGAFRPEYDAIAWDDWPQGFSAWCAGRTGYPLVDAGMRQLAHSGYMHNRLRMATASFLAKDLGIDWRLGERWFARHLNDFDLSANNGGWQWAASTGCDAQPYFRIFNPVIQSEKFDPRGTFIRRYVPELSGVPDRFVHAPWKMGAAEQRAAGVTIGRDYPAPIVDHDAARQRTLARYGVVMKRRASP